MTFEDVKLLVGIMTACAIWDWFCRAASSEEEYDNYLFPSNLSLFLGYLSFCFAAWHLSKVDSDKQNLGFAAYQGLGLVVTQLLSLYWPRTEKTSLLGTFSMVCFHSTFFMQGVLQNCFQDELSYDYKIIKQTHWNPIGFIVLVYIYGMLWAGSEVNQGHFVVYPFYLDTL